MKGMDEINVGGKVVLLRVDLNSPISDGKPVLNERITEHSKTILRLSERGAKVVLLAHQGRPGKKDFTSLEHHAVLVEKCTGKKVKWVPDVCGEDALREIKNLLPGEILLLDNVRMVEEEMKDMSPEEHAKSNLVRTLSSVAKIFINDAFSASHRSHASIVGFTKVLPSAAGRVLEMELSSLEKVSSPQRPCIYILGGAKPKDSFRIIHHVLSRNIADKILAGGVIGNIFLWSLYGVDVKEFSSFFDDARKLLESERGKIDIPVDVAVKIENRREEIHGRELTPEHLAWDIGSLTIQKFCKEIKSARTIVMNGPPGKYEEEDFSHGSREIYRAVASSTAFSLLGGGDTVSAIDSLGFTRDDFSYVSLGGHAMLEYLTGEKLPGLQALNDK
jgi:phosphoglycerate kinase